MQVTHSDLPTFVLVHGQACNSTIWGPVQRELSLRGRRSLALDLPGNGASGRRPTSYYQQPADLAAFAAEPSAVANVGVDAWAEHVLDEVRTVAEHGPVVLVGTSAGGVAITEVANRAPELLDRLVYVSAWCPVGSSTVAECMAWPEQQGNLFDAVPFPLLNDPARDGFARVNLRSNDPEFFSRMKAASMHDGTDEQFRAVLNLMEPDANLLAATEECRAWPETFGTVPRTYVRLAEDRSITLASQDRMIAEADAAMPQNPFDVCTVFSSHVGYFHRPADLVEVLVGV
ncbi:alpha/beta fold hydrolase [Allosaccharopolyspora coralli]|uniref:alpha/beta fold hydrolase n=1 Tax=Allosaccharopolyspora coralli TaxID=2665642 RepID=UPI001E3BF529|nr:alpha/beta hydrolase [Allosaccharopolyspora coralli]